MVRLPSPVAALVAALVVGSSVSVGGAVSAPPDLAPTVDPSLPELEAGSDPSPVMGDGTQKDAAPPHPNDASSPPKDSGASEAATLSNPDTGPAVPKPAQGEVLIT